MQRYYVRNFMVMAKKSAEQKRNKATSATPGRAYTINAHPLNDLLGFHLRLASLELRRNFTKHVGDGNIRPGLASLLLLVADNPRASQKSVSTAMHIDKASLVPLLNKAEAAGWLKRIRSKADRRRHELTLTPLGKTIAANLRKQVLVHEQEYLERFTQEELSNIVEYLMRIYQ